MFQHDKVRKLRVYVIKLLGRGRPGVPRVGCWPSGMCDPVYPVVFALIFVLKI